MKKYLAILLVMIVMVGIASAADYQLRNRSVTTIPTVADNYYRNFTNSTGINSTQTDGQIPDFARGFWIVVSALTDQAVGVGLVMLFAPPFMMMIIANGNTKLAAIAGLILISVCVSLRDKLVCGGGVVRDCCGYYRHRFRNVSEVFEMRNMENDEAISYSWFTTLLGALGLTVCWIALGQVVNEIILAFNVYVLAGAMSTQTATTAANMGAMFAAYPVILLVGYFVNGFFSASNVRNTGSSGGSAGFIAGAMMLLTGFVAVLLLAYAGGLVIDKMEEQVLDPANPITEIPQNWKDAQSATVPTGINMFFMSLYFAEGVMGMMFLQSLMGTTSGSSYYGRYG